MHVPFYEGKGVTAEMQNNTSVNRCCKETLKSQNLLLLSYKV